MAEATARSRSWRVQMQIVSTHPVVARVRALAQNKDMIVRAALYHDGESLRHAEPA